MLLLVSAALAHPDSLPHVHATDPLALGAAAFWVVVASAWFAYASRKPSVAASE